MNKSLFSWRDIRRTILFLFKGRGLRAGVLLAFLFLGFVGSPREAYPDIGDEIKKWVGLGKWVGPKGNPETKPESKPETNPSGTKTLSYSSSGTIEEVQKKSTPSPKGPSVDSPPQNYYHCLSGCEGACHFLDPMTVVREGSTLELTLINGNAKGQVDPQGNISIKSINLVCTGRIYENKIRLDCSDQNMSCQEVTYKI